MSEAIIENEGLANEGRSMIHVKLVFSSTDKFKNSYNRKDLSLKTIFSKKTLSGGTSIAF